VGVIPTEREEAFALRRKKKKRSAIKSKKRGGTIKVWEKGNKGKKG